MELIVSYIDKISKYDEDLDKAGIPHKSINDFLSLFEMIDLISNSNSISPALLKTDFEQISFAIHQLKTLSKSVLDQKSKIDHNSKRLFSIGVPVRANLTLAFISFTVSLLID